MYRILTLSAMAMLITAVGQAYITPSNATDDNDSAKTDPYAKCAPEDDACRRAILIGANDTNNTGTPVDPCADPKSLMCKANTTGTVGPVIGPAGDNETKNVNETLKLTNQSGT